jgi:hypothetical protein
LDSMVQWVTPHFPQSFPLLVFLLSGTEISHVFLRVTWKLSSHFPLFHPLQAITPMALILHLSGPYVNSYLHTHIFFWFFFSVLGLNSGLHAC